MNKCLAFFAVSVLVCLLAKPSIQAKDQDVEAALSHAPKDDKEIAKLAPEYRENFSKFCFSFRNRIVANIKQIEDKRLATKLAKQIFWQEGNTIQVIKAMLSFKSNWRDFCVFVPVYRKELDLTFKGYKEELSASGKSVDDVQLKDIKCVTVKEIIDFQVACDSDYSGLF